MQYQKNIFDPALNSSMYEYYVNLLYNCSTLFVYNIETNGFGKEKYFGGDILSYFDENTPV